MMISFCSKRLVQLSKKEVRTESVYMIIHTDITWSCKSFVWSVQIVDIWLERSFSLISCCVTAGASSVFHLEYKYHIFFENVWRDTRFHQFKVEWRKCNLHVFRILVETSKDSEFKSLQDFCSFFERYVTIPWIQCSNEKSQYHLSKTLGDAIIRETEDRRH